MIKQIIQWKDAKTVGYYRAFREGLDLHFKFPYLTFLKSPYSLNYCTKILVITRK